MTLALMAVVRDIEQKARKLNDKFVEPRVFKDKIGDWGQYAHEFAWRQVCDLGLPRCSSLCRHKLVRVLGACSVRKMCKKAILESNVASKHMEHNKSRARGRN